MRHRGQRPGPWRCARACHGERGCWQSLASSREASDLERVTGQSSGGGSLTDSLPRLNMAALRHGIQCSFGLRGDIVDLFLALH